MPWDLLLALGVNRLGLRVSEFWSITFAEWYALYNAILGKEKPMSSMDVHALEEAWVNGNTRGISSQA